MDFRTVIRHSLHPFKEMFWSIFSHQNQKSAHLKSKSVKNFSFTRSFTPECPIHFSTFIPNSISSTETSLFTLPLNNNSLFTIDDSSNETIENKSFTTLSFIVGSSCWPFHHPERGLVRPTESCNSYGVGDDAFLASPNLLAVADGVGGWSSVPGADASAYSRFLLHALYQFLFKKDLSSIVNKEPTQLLYDTVDSACTTVHHILGSSTLSMALLLRDDLLCLFNLGDSGIILMREGKCLFHSSPQCYHFNTPYQLGPRSKTKSTDGIIKLITPKLGDIILVATDGLFDNLDQEDIVKRISLISGNIAKGFIHPNQIDKVLADSCATLVAAARVNFSSAAKSKGSLISAKRFQDGKPDDITVLLGMVIDQSFSSSCK